MCLKRMMLGNGRPRGVSGEERFRRNTPTRLPNIQERKDRRLKDKCGPHMFMKIVAKRQSTA